MITIPNQEEEDGNIFTIIGMTMAFFTQAGLPEKAKEIQGLIGGRMQYTEVRNRCIDMIRVSGVQVEDGTGGEILEPI